VTTATPDIVVYTCIAGGYDELLPVEHPEPGVRYVCLSDRAQPSDRGWELRPLPASAPDPASANRFAKMHPHLLFPDHAVSVYVDGNIRLKPGVRAWTEQALQAHDFALHAHPFRDCIYDEAVECALIGHDWVWRYQRQMARYRREGLPARAGMFECNVLARRHGAAAVQALMKDWHAAYTHGVKRDQLSLPYLLWKSGFAVKDLGKSNIRRSDAGPFTLEIGHKREARMRKWRARVNRVLVPLNRWREGRPDFLSDR
jgi:hypothetical protein